ncbi:hypothetical protein Hdeb2414_s0009g00310021 [Helianthus debilis subsp. tardiflorus]
MFIMCANVMNVCGERRLIGSRRINKGQRSWTESHEGLYGVSKNLKVLKRMIREYSLRWTLRQAMIRMD